MPACAAPASKITCWLAPVMSAARSWPVVQYRRLLRVAGVAVAGRRVGVLVAVAVGTAAESVRLATLLFGVGSAWLKVTPARLVSCPTLVLTVTRTLTTTEVPNAIGFSEQVSVLPLGAEQVSPRLDV